MSSRLAINNSDDNLRLDVPMQNPTEDSHVSSLGYSLKGNVPIWNEDWSSFELQWELFFRFNKIPENDQAAVFRDLVTTTSFPGTLPTTESTADFAEVISVLRTQFRAFPTSSSILTQRCQFTGTTQSDKETLQEYAERLKTSAEHCAFPEPNERIRDQFVFGLKNSSVKCRLLSHKENLSWERTLLIAILCEKVLSDSEDAEEFNRLCAELNELTRPSSSRFPRKAKENGVSRQILQEILAEDYECNNAAADDPVTSKRSCLIDSPLNKGACKVVPTEETSPQEADERESSVEGTSQDDVPNKKPTPQWKRKKHIVQKVVSGESQLFSCQYCEYSSQYRRSVIRHERIHTGEKPFMCEYCSRTFREKQCLIGHIRSIHTGEKPFVCEYCSKAFAKKVNLNDHVRTHTKQTPYLCEFCGKGFAQKSALNTHVMTHTGGKPFVCQLCLLGFRTALLLKSHMREHEDASRKTQPTHPQPTATWTDGSSREE